MVLWVRRPDAAWLGFRAQGLSPAAVKVSGRAAVISGLVWGRIPFQRVAGFPLRGLLLGFSSLQAIRLLSFTLCWLLDRGPLGSLPHGQLQHGDLLPSKWESKRAWAREKWESLCHLTSEMTSHLFPRVLLIGSKVPGPVHVQAEAGSLGAS